MIIFILAGVLGVVAPVVFLLFRQLRQLSWQLTQQRVERDSERILQAIGLRPEQESQLAVLTADATLRKRHPYLYRDSVLAAALLKLRDLSPSRRYALAASGMIATIAVGLVTLLLVVSSGATPLGAGHGPPSGTASPESGAVSPEPTRSSGQPPGDRPVESADVHITGIAGSVLASETTAASARSLRAWSSSHAPPPSSSAQAEPSSQMSPPESSAPAPSVPPSGAGPPLVELCAGVRPLLELRLCLGLDG